MPHKSSCEQQLPGLSPSEKSLTSSDSLKERRRSSSLKKSISPGRRRRLYNKSKSVQDIVGGEQKATDINSAKRRTSFVKLNSAHFSSTVMNAEDKIHSIIQARETRQRRRSSLDNASPMINHSRKSFGGLPDERENITLPLNDATCSPDEVAKGGRRRRRSLGSIGTSDGSREHPICMTKALEESKSVEKKSINSRSSLSPFSRKSPGMKRPVSANSLRKKLHQRLQGVSYCDLNDSDHSHSDTEVNLKQSAYASDEDDCTAGESDGFMETPKKVERSRSKSRTRSRTKVSKKISSRDADYGEREESLKKPRSKSKNGIRSKSKSKQKRRSNKVEGHVVNNEASINSNTNHSTSIVQRRSVRRSKNVSEDFALVSESSDVECSSEFLSPRSSKSIELAKSSPDSPRIRKGRRRQSRNVLDSSTGSTVSYNASPGSLKGKKRIKTKKPSPDESGKNQKQKSRSVHDGDLSHVTEEKSEAFADPPKFLQFDPTSGNHVRSVDQKKAQITSESINGLHGMTKKLEIAEISGLPSFEKFTMGDSTSTGTTEESIGSSSHHYDQNNFFATIQTSPKKISFPRLASMASPRSPFQAPGGPLEVSSPQNSQWNLGSNSPHGTRNIGNAGKNLSLGKKGERDDKPMRRRSLDSGSGPRPARRNSLGSMMGLRGRYNSSDFGDGVSLLK